MGLKRTDAETIRRENSKMKVFRDLLSLPNMESWISLCHFSVEKIPVVSISIVSHLNQNKYYLCSLSPGLAYFQLSKLPSNIPNIFLHTTNRLLPRYLHGLLSQPLKHFVKTVSLFTLPCQFNFFHSSYPLIAHLIIYLFFHSLSLLTRMCAPWRQELNCWIPYLLCVQVPMQSE